MKLIRRSYSPSHRAGTRIAFIRRSVPNYSKITLNTGTESGTIFAGTENAKCGGHFCNCIVFIHFEFIKSTKINANFQLKIYLDNLSICF